jgi:hypothetical protein
MAIRQKARKHEFCLSREPDLTESSWRSLGLAISGVARETNPQPNFTQELKVFSA